MMFKHLNSEQIEGFQKDGFLYSSDLFDEKQARKYSFQLEEAEQERLDKFYAEIHNIAH